MIDVEAGVKKINQHIMDQGMVARDADGSDFAFPDDTSLRFKTGTSRGEVAITVWVNDRQRKEVIRVLSDAQLVEATYEIDAIITRHRSPEEVGVHVGYDPHNDWGPTAGGGRFA